MTYVVYNDSCTTSSGVENKKVVAGFAVISAAVLKFTILLPVYYKYLSIIMVIAKIMKQLSHVHQKLGLASAAIATLFGGILWLYLTQIHVQ